MAIFRDAQPKKKGDNNKSQTKADLKRVLEYVENLEKTRPDLISGFNCNPRTVYDDMILTKQIFNKNTGRQFKHYIHSYSSRETNLTPELAHEISMKLLQHEKFKDFQIFAVTHVDKDHIHTHYIINSVNIETGKKWNQSTKDILSIIEYSNNLCREYGLKYSSRKTGQKKNKTMSSGEYRAKQKRQSWKTEAFYAINDCRKVAISKEDFISKLESLGYKVRWEDSRKNITFTLPNGKKLNNDKLHPPKNFTKEALLKSFDLNKQIQEIGKKNILQNEFEARKEVVLQTMKMLEDNPYEGHKDYPRSYLEGQALKELMIEKAKGEGLDWSMDR